MTTKLAALTLALVAMFVPTAGAADPGTGTISPASPQVDWAGGPFEQSLLVPCGGPNPLCDEYVLDVDAELGSPITIAVASDNEADDIDLFVHGPTGLERTRSSTAGGLEKVVFKHDGGPYTVRVAPYAVSPGATYHGMARLGGRVDELPSCTAPAPEHIGVRGVTDDGSTIGLEVLVLLDGVSEDSGRLIFSKAQRSYTPVGLELRPTFQTVDFSAVGTETAEMILAAKALYPQSQIPEEFDVVHVLTSKDLWAITQEQGAGNGVAGQADCIGGVGSPSKSYSVSEAFGGDFTVGPMKAYVDWTAKAAAHEIGHLLGAHHHYGNCVEGNSAESLQTEMAYCTLMGPVADFLNYDFGSLNAAVVRGHAVEYARP